MSIYYNIILGIPGLFLIVLYWYIRKKRIEKEVKAKEKEVKAKNDFLSYFKKEIFNQLNSIILISGNNGLNDLL